jgi:hypothetical protein
MMWERQGENEKMSNICNILVKTAQKKKQCGRHLNGRIVKWRELYCGEVDWIEVIQNSIKWFTFFSTVMNL